MRVIIITYPTPKQIRKFFPIKASDYVIAVDQAVMSLKEQRIHINLAVGDFDSLVDRSVLLNLNVVRLNPIKDVTDTHQALVEASKIDYDELYLLGGMGGERIEHFMVHTMFFHEFPKMIMKDENSTIYVLGAGVHDIISKDYVNFFAYPKTRISLDGFKYDLTQYTLTTYDPLCISNEVINPIGKIHVHDGKVMVVVSKRVDLESIKK
jgi:thiamine pyrophosphokinase